MPDLTCTSLVQKLTFDQITANMPGPQIPDLSKDAPKELKAILSLHDYLEGPKSRSSELLFTVKVVQQFIRGFRKLHFVGPCVTVFGSARFPPGHDYYKMAEDVGRAIAKTGFTVMTGGGPGIMEAANKGAVEAGGYSVGCNINLPREQAPNEYMHEWVTLDYFFVRKFLLLKYSYAFVVLPGGWGTMDELFETLTLVQTGMIHHFPIVLMGKDYYQALMDYLNFMLGQGTISAEDLKLIRLTDDPHEAMEHLAKYISDFYMIKKKKPKRYWALGENRNDPNIKK